MENKNISLINTMKNALPVIDIYDAANCKKGKLYQISFDIDGRGFIILNNKGLNGITKKLTQSIELVEGHYGFMVKTFFDGKISFEILEPKDAREKKWTEISNIVITEV